MSQPDAEPAETAADHLAREWQLFQAVERGAASHLCRIWESRQPVVVVGRSPGPDQVIQDACWNDRVPVLRRCSGGGAVVLGPGCLNYAIGLSLVTRPDLMDVAASFEVILGRLAARLDVPGLAVSGGTDLARWDRKVSGNAQRRGRRALLHHGTLLYAFDAGLAARYLKEPARQPAYRQSRRHQDFLGNLPLTRDELVTGVLDALEGLKG